MHPYILSHLINASGMISILEERKKRDPWKKRLEGYPCNIAGFYTFDILLELSPTLAKRSISVRLSHITTRHTEHTVALQTWGRLERNAVRGQKGKKEIVAITKA